MYTFYIKIQLQCTELLKTIKSTVLLLPRSRLVIKLINVMLNKCFLNLLKTLTFYQWKRKLSIGKIRLRETSFISGQNTIGRQMRSLQHLLPSDTIFIRREADVGILLKTDNPAVSFLPLSSSISFSCDFISVQHATIFLSDVINFLYLILERTVGNLTRKTSKKRTKPENIRFYSYILRKTLWICKISLFTKCRTYYNEQYENLDFLHR